MTLTTIDWIIIVGYFVTTIAVGLWFSRRAGKSLAEYFVSGRSLPWWVAGTSMVATTFAADTPLAVTGLIAKNGLAGNWVWWAFAMGGMVTVFVYARLWRRAEVMTDVELTEMRYSGKPAAALRGIRAVYVALIINPIIVGWVTGAMLTVLKSTVFSETGSTAAAADSIASDWGIILICLAVVGVYCSLSGLWGVAVTDMIQFFTAMIGCILLALIAVRHVGGMAALEQQVVERFGDDQAFRFLPSFTAEDPWMPLHVFCIFLLVQWWATWYPGAEPGGGGFVVQRMAACKDERHAVLATLWYQVAHYCLRPWPWLLVAFVALAIYPEVRENALSDSPTARADAGFAWVMRDLSPVGLRGLMLVTFAAAFMSTISTQMNWGASYLVRDVYQRFINPDADEHQLTRVSRWVSIFVLGTGAVAAYIMKDVDIDQIWKILLALGAGTGGVYMLRWFWWRINAWSEIVAMLGSLFFFLLFRSFLDIRDEELMFLVAGATIVAWLIATFLTAPTDQDRLLSFYRKVRPGGPGWKPVAELAPEVKTDRNLGLSLLAAALSAAIVYSVLPTVGCFLFGHYLKAFIGLTVSLVLTDCVVALMRRMGWGNVV
ncbi:MAG: Na+:solute symporter [bacterium]|nr:Na+:solute symporter [bacterium]